MENETTNTTTETRNARRREARVDEILGVVTHAVHRLYLSRPTIYDRPLWDNRPLALGMVLDAVLRAFRRGDMESLRRAHSALEDAEFAADRRPKLRVIAGGAS